MKGSFLLAGKEFLLREYGSKVWEEAASACGLSLTKHILPIADFDDEIALCIASRAAEIIGIPMDELAERFGRFWGREGARTFYGIFYKESTCAKQFLLNLNHFHQVATKSMRKASPPLFEFWWEQRNVLTMKYISKRNFYHLAVGAIRGVGEYFNEDLIVEKIPPDKIKVIFS